MSEKCPKCGVDMIDEGPWNRHDGNLNPLNEETFCLRRQRDALAARVAEFEERRALELAAISTATTQNTKTTVKLRIGSEHPYCTQAYLDVCTAVDREMQLLARLVTLESENTLLSDELSREQRNASQLRLDIEGYEKAIRELEAEAEAVAWKTPPAMAQAKIDELNAKVATLYSRVKELEEAGDRLESCLILHWKHDAAAVPACRAWAKAKKTKP